MFHTEKEQNKAADSLRERSVSWSEGLNGAAADNTEAAKRLKLLLAQSQEVRLMNCTYQL